MPYITTSLPSLINITPGHTPVATRYTHTHHSDSTSNFADNPLCASDHLTLAPSTHRKTTLRPKLGSPVPQAPDTSHTTNQQTAQQRDSPTNPQIDIQWIRPNDASSRHHSPAQVVGRKQTRRILRIRQRQVHEDALEQHECPYRE